MREVAAFLDEIDNENEFDCRFQCFMNIQKTQKILVKLMLQHVLFVF